LYVWVAAAIAAAGAASASTLIVGEGPAFACYQAALRQRNDAQALQECNFALREELLSPRDYAATTNNRGIIHLNRREAREALDDFNAAARIEPDLGEVHLNRGAALILMGDYAGAIESINRGLELGTDDDHEAYFNRAIAHELSGDVRSAYHDYRRASELRPDWTLPQLELRRFTVRSAEQQSR
jgi:tetratricopeptide (TPR) repeat protein